MMTNDGDIDEGGWGRSEDRDEFSSSSCAAPCPEFSLAEIRGRPVSACRPGAARRPRRR